MKVRQWVRVRQADGLVEPCAENDPQRIGYVYEPMYSAMSVLILPYIDTAGRHVSVVVRE